jgi:hypothetical protein
LTLLRAERIGERQGTVLPENLVGIARDYRPLSIGPVSDGGDEEAEYGPLGAIMRAMATSALRFPPTSPDLLDPDARPYFIWWAEVTVRQLHVLARSDDLLERAYWLGALMREANTRDVWLFASPSDLRAMWEHVVRHLGRTREMWAWLLGVPAAVWPPAEARHA